MRVGLAPVLALLGEAAASDSPRHDSGCGGFSLPWVASGWEDFGGWTFCDCANDVPWGGVIAAGLRKGVIAAARGRRSPSRGLWWAGSLPWAVVGRRDGR